MFNSRWTIYGSSPYNMARVMNMKKIEHRRKYVFEAENILFRFSINGVLVLCAAERILTTLIGNKSR